MKYRRLCVRAVLAAAIGLLVSSPAFGQFMYAPDLEMPEATPMEHGEATPYFWIGAQQTGSIGYNLDNNAFGIRRNDGYVSFSFSLVDSMYDTPKQYVVGDDPDVWSGRVLLRNFTYRVNSYDDDNNSPIWLAEVQGKGFHIGLFGQAGEYRQGDGETTISSGGKVLYFADSNALNSQFLDTPNPYTTASYNSPALAYLGYTQQNLFSTYLTLATEGDVDTEVTEEADGIAGVIDFTVTPLGVASSAEVPFTVEVSGNVMGGTRFEENPLGFGVKAEPSIFLGENRAVNPILAFDAQIPEGESVQWGVGGGVLLQLSAPVFTTDVWGELSSGDAQNYFSDIYERDGQLQRYTYAQLYAAYSESDDLDLAFKYEEPEGEIGMIDKLGAMTEFRLNNLLQSEGNELGWSAAARVSYDLMEGQLVPYARTYVNSEDVVKLRTGAHFSFFPHAGFELAYTSRNLNSNSEATGTDEYSKGRIELLMRVSTSSGTIRTQRRMSDLNY
ncbi:MAG: hypothetical protein ACOCVC_06320 [Spirochaeta sp.]